ncbi:hypothetical protein JCM11641_008134 [Rhodosporidiobolus odoratus]
MASPPYKMTKMHHSPPTNCTSLPHQSSVSSAHAISSSRSAPPLQTSTKRIGLATAKNASGASKGVKKLSLKHKTSTAGPSSLTSTAPAVLTLTRAVRAIGARPPQPTPVSLQALYTTCESLSTSPSACADLYERVKMELERVAGESRRTLSTGGDAEEGERWLGEVQTEGEGYLRKSGLVRSVLLGLDRGWALQSPGVESLWDLGLDVYRHSVLADSDISARITSTLLRLIERERDGDLIPRTLLQSLLSLLRTFSPSIHTSLFVSPFLSSTRTCYNTEGLTQSTALDSSAYLKRVTQRLEQEAERCDSVLGSELRKEVVQIAEDELIKVHVEGIAEKDTSDMCKTDNRSDLSALYILLTRIGKVDVLRRSFFEHLKSAGLSLVQDTSQDAQMVPNLIAFRHKAQALVKECFQADEDFRGSVNSAFQFFVNKRENKPAEMMAKYLDAKLRSGNKGMDDAALEATLNDVLYLFRFTQGKDIFEAFYKRDLAKRLLLNKSASFDAERSMLLKLKDECGPGFTQKLELMFKDMELSSDVMSAYSLTSLSRKSSSATAAKNGFGSSPGAAEVDLSVSILSQGNWPTYPPFPISLPPSLTQHLERFKAFYVSKHSGRTLSWAHGLDTVSLRAQFPKGGRKELLVSLAQAVVLLLFNEIGETKLGVEEIREGTGLELKELNRTLQSLACGKVRVLVKHPKGRDVNPGDQFSFNEDFKDDHVRIKINQIQQKETAEENKSTTERVFTDRSSHLQLAIVRIMKARKTLKHSELVMEVVSQIGQRFKVEPAEIKKSISSLIDREYMRRSEEQQNVYEYVA